MKFLIPTEPDDTHALTVKFALESLGHEVRLLFTADLPTRQKNSVFIDNFQYHWKSADQEQTTIENNYDVVWWRRARKPFLPKEAIHPEDYTFVRQQNHLFHEAITNTVAPHAWWINSKQAAMRANSKLLQLKLAVECGLTIPTTLFSNDPIDIRTFLLKHDNEGVIYKPFFPAYWIEEEQIKIAYTSKISFLKLPSNKILQLAPGIFQKEVRKKYELRIIALGDYLIAARLNSQQTSNGKIDWRAEDANKLDIEPYQLPNVIANKIRKFMRKLGIVFGAFDFIVTPDKNYVFLEVNEQGQFLWLEEYNPDIRLLDSFVKFMINKDRSFIWDKNHLQFRLEEYLTLADETVTRNLQNHVSLNQFNLKKGSS